jgi:transposase-like protein
MAGERMTDKERFWREMLGKRRSGQTIRAFCEEHGLSEPSFYAWRRMIAERDQLAGSPSDEFSDRPAFVPVRVAGEAVASPELEVVADGGRVVRVPIGFDAATLRRLLAVLEEGSSC